MKVEIDIIEAANPVEVWQGGFYGPDFANIRSGWYWETGRPNYAPARELIKKHWSDRWDQVLLDYLRKYGTFFSAFLEGFESQFAERSQIERNDIRYFCYFVQSRAWLLPQTRAIWVESYERELRQHIRCETCKKTERKVDIHPKAIRNQWPDIKHCYLCDYVIGDWKTRGIPDPALLVSKSYRNIQIDTPKCENCGGTIEAYKTGTKSNDPRDISRWLFANTQYALCGNCYSIITSDHNRGTRELKLIRLKEFVDFLGRVPQQDFQPLIFLFDRPLAMKAFLAHVKKLRDATGYKEDFETFLNALILAGALPSGTRKLQRGTMVLADDGHLCLSRPEKSIDDFLTRCHVMHRKEVLYPGCHYRADWAIETEGKTIYIEYFGLHGDIDYDTKSREKARIASDNGIHLVSLYPKDKWEDILRSELQVL